MHKTLADLQFNIQVYAASWHAMSQASRAIAGGLAKLAQGGDGGSGSGSGQDKEGVSSLMETVRTRAWGLQRVDMMLRGREMIWGRGVSAK